MNSFGDATWNQSFFIVTEANWGRLQRLQPKVVINSLRNNRTHVLQLLVLRQDKRATAKEALRHPFFTKHAPKPCDPSELPLPIPEERKHKVRGGGPVKASRQRGPVKRAMRLTTTHTFPTRRRIRPTPPSSPPRLIHLPPSKQI